MSRYFSFSPYVPAAERRRRAAAAAKKLQSKSGRPLSPVHIPGRAIASTFWGKAWCDNLEAYSDFSNRLPRGRTYARNGSIIDLEIAPGQVRALVQGSSLYKIAIDFAMLEPKRWAEFKRHSAGKITNLLDLLQGRISKEMLADITAPSRGLFPAPKEIKLSCSCPDWADMCKHVAAVLYGVGARLDEKPELFFTLRGVDMQELQAAASAISSGAAASAAKDSLAGADLSEVFGIEIETSKPVPAAGSKTVAPRARKAPALKKAKLAKAKPAKAKPRKRRKARG